MTPEHLTRELQDKRLRIEFNDGQTDDVLLLLVSECDEHEECRGIEYDVISTNRPDRIRKGAACWAHLKDIRNFEVFGDPNV